MSGKLLDPSGENLTKQEIKYRHRSLSKKSEDNARHISLGKYD
jgi:hypothetical protein